MSYVFPLNKSCLKISTNHLLYTKLAYEEIIKTIFAKVHISIMWVKLC